MALTWLHHDDHAGAQWYEHSLHLKFSCPFKDNIVFSIWTMVANLASTNPRS